jgi:leader peptidase (prepilin peptidase)/N-methyltransferase
VLSAGATGVLQPADLGGALRAFVTLAAAGFGLLIGSFLNVVIARVPEDRSVVRPGSACPACGEPIAGRDNVPVASWLLLRGRARCCGEPISPVYPIVEAGTGVAFAAVTAWAGLSWLLPSLLYLAAISIALTVIDVRVHRLPDPMVLPSYPVVAALLVLAALAGGEPLRLRSAAIGGVALLGLYFAIKLAYPPGMGLGDVKFAGVLGMYLGYFGWPYAVVGGFLGFVVGGVVALGLAVGGRVGRKTQFPYGPSMIAGAWLALIWAAPIMNWYLHRSGLSVVVP